jgi:hypothetical protein
MSASQKFSEIVKIEEEIALCSCSKMKNKMMIELEKLESSI